MCVCGAGAFSVVDLVAWAEDARLPLSGSIPQALAAVFSLDDSQIYLSHMDVYDGDSTYLHTVANDGENSEIVDSISIGKKGFLLEMNAAGDTLYVGCRGFSTDESRKVAVVDLGDFSLETDILLPDDPDNTNFQRPVDIQLSADESILYTVTSDGYLHVNRHRHECSDRITLHRCILRLPVHAGRQRTRVRGISPRARGRHHRT